MTTIEKIVFKAVPESEFKEQYEVWFEGTKKTSIDYDEFIKTFYRLADRNLFHVITEFGARKYKRKTTTEILNMM